MYQNVCSLVKYQHQFNLSMTLGYTFLCLVHPPRLPRLMSFYIDQNIIGWGTLIINLRSIVLLFRGLTEVICRKGNSVTLEQPLYLDMVPLE
jgi:hypothetical protein